VSQSWEKNNAAAMEAYAVKGFGSIYKELNGHKMMFHPEASLLRELFNIYVDLSWQIRSHRSVLRMDPA